MSLDNFKNFYYKYNSPVVFKIKGPDAAGYLQARLSNDFRTLLPKTSFLAACLTPQGKTEGLFYIYKLAEDEFILFTKSGDLEQIKTGLFRFKVADYFEIDVLNNLSLVATDNSTSIPENLILASYQEPDSKLAYHLTEKDFTSDLRLLAPEEYKAYRYSNAIFDFPTEIKPESLFPESGLTNAISYQKGCYAGQEVIERVSALGKLPASLKVYSTALEVDTSLPITSGEVTAGSIIDSASYGQGRLVLARVKTKFIQAKLHLGQSLLTDL